MQKRLPANSENEESSSGAPERNLWARVVESAIRDVLKWDSKKARKWIASNERHPYSFVWACEVIEMDPREIRRAMIKQGKNILKKL